MKVGLHDLLPQAAESDYAIAGFNIFSIDWARAVIRAAEQLNSPVIIMLNKSMANNLPPQFSGPILSQFAEEAKVPVCVHLDHCTDFEILKSAIDSGYSSVMYDGSYLPLEENIQNTKEICKLAHQQGVSIEGEVGTVRYVDNPDSSTNYTSPDEALQFAEQTQVDALAISIGTTHRQTTRTDGSIQFDRLEAIQEKVSTPLVIHGTSGISENELIVLKKHRIAKFNIGTILRLAFARTLREVLQSNETIFDRLEIMELPYKSVEEEAYNMLKILRSEL